MGCNNCSNAHDLSEMINERQSIINQNEEGNKNENELFNSNSGDEIINFEEEKQKIMEKLSLKGSFLKEDINLILDKINPKINSFEIPTEKLEKELKSNIIKLPLIKMNDGGLYEGNWNLEGEKEGFGICIYNDEKIYKGLWKNGNFDEFGCLFNNKNNYYIGQFSNGIAKGKGELLINNKIKIVGEFDNDLPNGKGNIVYLEDQIDYTGNIVNGVKDGFGKLKFKDGTVYEGEFKEDKYNGKGKIMYSDNSEYEGDFHNNLKEGKGIFKWADGKIYEGEFKNDKKHGKGKFILKTNQFYEGCWINDFAHGKGLYDFNGKKYFGIFKYGKMIIEKNNDNSKNIF